MGELARRWNMHEKSAVCEWRGAHENWEKLNTSGLKSYYHKKTRHSRVNDQTCWFFWGARPGHSRN